MLNLFFEFILFSNEFRIPRVSKMLGILIALASVDVSNERLTRISSVHEVKFGRVSMELTPK